MLASAIYGFASVGTAFAGVRDLCVVFATAGWDYVGPAVAGPLLLLASLKSCC